MKEVMDKFDEEQAPKLLRLQKECKDLGHKNGIFRSDESGWSWVHCCICNARTQIFDHRERLYPDEPWGEDDLRLISQIQSES